MFPYMWVSNFMVIWFTQFMYIFFLTKNSLYWIWSSIGDLYCNFCDWGQKVIRKYILYEKKTFLFSVGLCAQECPEKEQFSFWIIVQLCVHIYRLCTYLAVHKGNRPKKKLTFLADISVKGGGALRMKVFFDVSPNTDLDAGRIVRIQSYPEKVELFLHYFYNILF